MATGHVRDPLSPYGHAHPLMDLSVMLGSLSLGEPLLTDRPALELITAHPRTALRLPSISVAVGDPADLVLLDAAEPEWLPRGFEQVRQVLKAGQVVWPS